MDAFGDIVRIPDFWQSQALAHLQAGRDVIIDAPTGAGKTYVFEMFIERGFSGRAVYTVPTRALANDKYAEWKSRGWRVGISTGDYCADAAAPVVVATLETQKNAVFSGECPDLLVIDEYQLLADPARGFNYELAIALAPPATQLLLISGSVGNTADVQKWFARLGRDCRVVSHAERAVPLEEIVSTSLPDGDTRGIYGMWPKLVKRIIDADMAPVLIFAPRRTEAEALARSLAAGLPCPDFLNLPKDDAAAAGRELANMLRRRVAFHHSGLSARQRSAIVERYAREGKLKAVVATTGLGAGVNFSMRSAIVVSREYETVSGAKILRADELLQMYGRAGRRGKDKLGYAVVLPRRPRLSDAKQCALRRVNGIDAAASIRIMARAADTGKDHVLALKNFCSRLFAEEKIDIGWRDVERLAETAKSARARGAAAVKIEILNSRNIWERRRAKAAAKVCETLFYEGRGWVPFLKSARAAASVGFGRVCRVGAGYGILLDIAFERGGVLALTKFARRAVARARAADASLKNYFAQPSITLKNLRRNFGKIARACFAGAEVAEIAQSGGVVRAKIDISNARVMAVSDGYGEKLYRPPEREIDASGELDFARLAGLEERPGGGSAALQWRGLGLVGDDFKPTLRGRIFSFFNGGEGCAIAAAVLDESYEICDLVFDIANLRAGGRFQMSQTKASASSRLADVCRLAFGAADFGGALKAGVPVGYGEGASEIVRELCAGARVSAFESDMILRGDIERALLEWRSFMRYIASLPDIDGCPRWGALKAACAARLGGGRA